MYLRHTTVRKNGKAHTYWLLVRSVRCGTKVRQQVVATLGKLDPAGQRRARSLANKIMGRRMQPSLFEPREEKGPDIASIKLSEVRLERTRRFGDVYLGLTLWHALQLDEVFERLLPEGREDAPWSVLAAALVVCRLCMPSSELKLAQDLYRQTALDDLLGLPEDKVNDDRLYRALDQILPHKDAVEMHLKERIGTLFDVKFDILLYDVTSTYFEGLALRNPQAKRGHSRDHRPDCKQVCVALVVTREGVPLAHEVFDGNRIDVTTVQEIVTKVETKFGAADRVWVMDRGMASKQNIDWLQKSGRRYVIGANRSDLNRLQQRIVEQKDWKRIREDVEVKLCPGPNGQETYVLCRSETRKAKDTAIMTRFLDRLRQRIASLQRRLAKAKKPIDRDRVNQQIGRMLAHNTRVAKAFAISVEASSSPAGIELIVKENADWARWLERNAGCYLLRSNVANWTEDELWRTYIQLTEAEDAFRVHKSDLAIRPVWHHREDRVKSHIFVCFLAYALWKTLELWQERAGLGNSPATLLRELSQVQSADVVLPVTDGADVRLRCVVRPNQSQANLLDRLGLELPRRLRSPQNVATASV